MKLLTLFFSFLQIGAFSFGGGYAALPLIQHQVVDLYHWLTMNELTDLITISQMTPGPIAINAATFVGLKIDSFYGAIVATLGCILPSCIIVSLIAYIYLKYQQMSIIQNILKYIRPAVVSLIAVSGLLIIVSCFFWRYSKLCKFEIWFCSHIYSCSGFIKETENEPDYSDGNSWNHTDWFILYRN